MESYNAKRNIDSPIKSKLDWNNSDDNLAKKSKAKRNSIGLSDVDTADARLESLKMDLNIVRANFEASNNGYIYIGQLVEGKKEGKGIIKNPNGDVIYDGFFRNDLYEGEGILKLDNGLIYSGNFLKGKRNGRGNLFSNEDKYRYEGEWLDDQKSGRGTETYPDNSCYCGEFLNNKRNGKGDYYLNDGSIYQGEFTDDKIEGYGKLTWTENRVYEGQWKNNCIHGFGIFVKNDKIYIGKIKI